MDAEKQKPGRASGGPGSAVAVVGGGPAGLAAAVLGVQHGLGVELFERRARLGGRADSFVDPAAGRLIDYCQHVGLGCCRVLADFCRRTGVDDCFEAFADIHLLSPEGRRYDLAPSRWLPAPCHLLPSLLRLGYLSLGERLAILRTARRLRRKKVSGTVCAKHPPARSGKRFLTPFFAPFSAGGQARPAHPAAQAAEQTIYQWLRAQSLSRRAIDEFWSLVLLSALAETPDRIAFSAAAQVLSEGLFGSRLSHALMVPRMPLAEIFDRRVGDWLEHCGVALHRKTTVQRIERSAAGSSRGMRLLLGDGTVRQFDFAVIAVPPHRLPAMLPREVRAAHGWLEHLGELPTAGITGVHLWFDRPILDLPQAALVGRTTQWLFLPERSSTGPSRPSRSAAQDRPAEGEWYCQAVVSASHRLLSRDAQKTVGRVLDDLRAVLPAARGAVLRRWRVINRPAAVLALHPGVEARRAAARVLAGPVVLAGDWTATGWPATLESAVRSGYMAVEAVLEMCGRPAALLAPATRTRWPQLEE